MPLFHVFISTIIHVNMQYPQGRLVVHKATTSAPVLIRWRFQTNLSTLVRHETMEDRPYVVVPMVMIVEGILNNLLYTADDLAKTPEAWNLKPVIVYHPTYNGEPISACSVEVVNKMKIGVIMNTKWNATKKRLEAEAWLEEARVKKVDERVWNALENGTMLELSTGLFVDSENEPGEFNGKSYGAVARNYRPDHLAVLPDQIGACSIVDGAGFLRVNSSIQGDEPRRKFFEIVENARKDFLSKLSAGGFKTLAENELSQDQTREQLMVALRKRYATEALDPKSGYLQIYLCEVYDNYVVFEIGYDAQLLRLDYSKTASEVKLSTTTAQKVTRVVEYRTNSGPATNNKQEQLDMNRKDAVDGLIKNHGFAESDRDWLMGLKDEQFKPIAANAAKTAELAANAAKEKAAKEKADREAAELAANKGKDKPKEPTMEEYLATVPAALRGTIKAALQTHEDEKAKLVDEILANVGEEEPIYEKAELESLEVNSLRKLAKATKRPEIVTHEDEPVVRDFSGAASGAPAANADDGVDVTPLSRPTWEAAKK